MDNILEITSVPLIVTLVYGIIEGLKKAISQDAWKKYIPLIAGVLGGVLGGAVYFFFPEIIVVSSLLSAIVLGTASGLTATGANQFAKIFQQVYTQIESGNLESSAETAEQTEENQIE